MTYNDDPNMRRGQTGNDSNYTSWILGGIAALAVILGLFFMFGRDDGTSSTANTNTNRPAATAPANTSPPATTGSSATAPAPANR